MEITGKTVVITGASSGIGRAAALEFSRRGARVVLAARRAPLLEEVAAECRALGASASVVPTDVSRRKDCVALIAAAGTVDILVNNAGFAIFDSIAAAKPEDAEGMMATNYFGTLYCTQAVLPQMLERGSGSIVIVASIAGLMGLPRMGAYCAAKFALVGMAEALRHEVSGKGVRVALVCPGTVDTDFFVTAQRGKLPGASRLLIAIKPERVARAICDAAEDGRYRRILPMLARLLIRFKEHCPRFTHMLFGTVSSLLEKR